MSELAKSRSAEYAIKEYIQPKEGVLIVGIGSGTTVVYAVEHLKRFVDNEQIDIICVPSSFQAKQLILKYNLPLSDIEVHPCVDITIDGADEIDADLTMIKGGGGCLTMEKILAFNSKKYIIMADAAKSSRILGEKWKNGIPIEVIPISYAAVSRRLRQFGYDPCLRSAVNKAGPLITDNGGFILDAKFDPTIKRNWYDENAKISLIPGVIETGLFINMADFIVFGKAEGSTYVLANNKKESIKLYD